MKKITILLTSFLLVFNCFAFDWPQEEITQSSYNSYFGQNVGNKLNTSLTFSEPAEIKVAENGHILLILTEENDDSMFFPSTLGTAVILSHDDNLLSVYGNIDQETLALKDHNETFLDSGSTLGFSGTSGYHTKKGNLEFQIIDTKNKSAINPKVLMPRSETELPLTITGVKIQNKNNEFYDLSKVKNYSSGLYRIYFKRNEIASPYKTSVLINGVAMDQISYDTIIQENNKLCVSGKKKYTSSDVYPNKDLQLVGETMLTPGKATLILSISDILGNTKQVSYNIVIN